MTDISGISPVAVPNADASLRQTAKQLEGVFVEQLFKAMRETVPEGGLTDGGSGEDIFSGLMDQHLAEQVPNSWERGLGAALYRQPRGVVTETSGMEQSTTPDGTLRTEDRQPTTDSTPGTI